MNPITEDIKDFLVEAGAGEFGVIKESVWGIFIGKEPDEPTNTITLYITPGIVEKQMNNDRHFYHSAFQIRVRSNNYKQAYAKTVECSDALDRIGSSVNEQTNTIYNNIVIDDEPLPLPKDTKSRSIFVVNGTAFRRKIA